MCHRGTRICGFISAYLFFLSKQWRSHFPEIQMMELLPRWKNCQLIQPTFLEIPILLRQSVNNQCWWYLTLLKTHTGTLFYCVPTQSLSLIVHFPSTLLYWGALYTDRVPGQQGSEPALEAAFLCFCLEDDNAIYLSPVLWEHFTGKENKFCMATRENQYAGHVQQHGLKAIILSAISQTQEVK